MRPPSIAIERRTYRIVDRPTQLMEMTTEKISQLFVYLGKVRTTFFECHDWRVEMADFCCGSKCGSFTSSPGVSSSLFLPDNFMGNLKRSRFISSYSNRFYPGFDRGGCGASVGGILGCLATPLPV